MYVYLDYMQYMKSESRTVYPKYLNNAHHEYLSKFI